MQETPLQIELSEKVLESIHTKQPVEGLTHTFYKYPARFSHRFPRSIIEDFSDESDVVFDPFMGSGTTLVEAMVCGRDAIGSDINSLAHFVATVKTTLLGENDQKAIEDWLRKTLPKLNVDRPPERPSWWVENGYQKDLPSSIRKILEFILSDLESLQTHKQKKIIRCAALSAGKWALDCTQDFPSVEEFRDEFEETVHDFFLGFEQLRQNLEKRGRIPEIVCLNEDAVDLSPDKWQHRIEKRPSLVVTSPPYPGVHVLYHRWQIQGRRETPAPYWIAGSPDGHGGSYYTMGGRSKAGLEKYFKKLTKIYRQLHSILEDDALVFQLVAFSDIEKQTTQFLSSMRNAGFYEVKIEAEEEGPEIENRLWRQVPSRRWYASLQGKTSSSREFLIVHRKAN